MNVKLRETVRWPEPPVDPLGWFTALGLGLIVTAAFVAVRASMTPFIGFQTPYVVFTLAVAVAAWWGGWRAGVLTTAFSLAAGHAFFVRPFPQRGIPPRDEPVRIAIFAVVCLLLVLLAHIVQTAKSRLKRLTNELEVERARFHAIFEHAPALMVTLSGDDLIYEHANETYLRLRGRADVIGKPLNIAVPTAEANGFASQIRQVMATGEPFGGKSAPFETEPLPDGTSEIRHYDYTYVPLREADGKVRTVLGHAVDVTDRVQAEAALLEVKAELEQRVEDRTAELRASIESLQGFTYHVSHDLRAPLRTIASYSRMIRDDFGDALPQEAHALLARQDAAAKRLGALIDDLLKYARLSQSELVRKEVDVSAAARHVTKEILAMYPESQIRFEIAPDLVARADPGQVRILLGNLIENAVKYSPDGGTIRVGHRDDGTFFVSDEGIGIDPEYFGKIFEAFERLHRDDQFAGTGIGLANVKQIVQRHGGRVWVESEPGRGSTFLFTLGGA